MKVKVLENALGVVLGTFLFLLLILPAVSYLWMLAWNYAVSPTFSGVNDINFIQSFLLLMILSPFTVHRRTS